jgi:acetyl/propionyl-CoA carboxylase alpha subunit
VIYEVSERGETLRVELREVGEGLYDLVFEGRAVRVDAAKSGRTIYSIIEDGRQFEAMVEERGAHGFDILVHGRLFHLEAVDERSRLLVEQARSVSEGPQTVTAQMPGKVVKLHVRCGEAVREGQGVVVVEAMKMENEIASPIDGVVTELPVAEGRAVETGEVLFVVEPAPAAQA